MKAMYELKGEYKNLEMIGELQAHYDSRKSFYGKAKILKDDDGILYLLSYDTVVSQAKNGVVEHFGKYSQTTTRHQKEFEKQFSN